MRARRLAISMLALVAVLGVLLIQPAFAAAEGESHGNPGSEVSNGSSPEPSGGGGGSNGESNGNPGNEVSNGASPQPRP